MTCKFQLADPDTGKVYAESPPDRFWRCEVYAKRRVGIRIIAGTVSIGRMAYIVAALARRYPRMTKTPPPRGPIVYRAFRGGPVVMIVHAIDGRH